LCLFCFVTGQAKFHFDNDYDRNRVYAYHRYTDYLP